MKFNRFSVLVLLVILFPLELAVWKHIVIEG
jgi:hypothetical protein